ncbi:MAG: CopD family protein [Betaproteobacteria bacterium]
MTTYALMLFIHILASTLWVGGMFTMHCAVRPAAVALLPPPPRLPLMTAALGRFFDWVVAAVFAVLGSGLAMMFGARTFSALHPSVHLMFALGVAMIAIFAVIRLLAYRRLRAAVAVEQWPAAAKQLDAIRKLVAVNLVLGIVTIAVATLGRALF